jgi:hypothetical protein
MYQLKTNPHAPRRAVAAAFAAALGAFSLFASTAPAQLGFGPPAPLNGNAATDAGLDQDPALATDGAGNWIAAWDSTDDFGGPIGTDADILYSRSSDNGLSWSPPAPLNLNASADSESDRAVDLATNGAGVWIAVWASEDPLGATIGTDFDILYATSNDNGANWSAPAPIAAFAFSDAASDFAPSIATDGAGNWIVVWQSDENVGGTIGSDIDILFATSTNDGSSWSAATALASNAATDGGGDFAPAIATAAGDWVVAWWTFDNLGGTIGTDPDILVSGSSNAGASWGPIATLNTNANSDGLALDLNPALATDGAGNWIAAWYSNATLGGTIGSDNDILCATSIDAGATWSAPAPLNANAATDFGEDFLPRLSTDGSGNWVAVWQSTDDLGATIGVDVDVLAARSTNAGATWTSPSPLNANAATDAGDDGLPAIGVGMGATWVAAWNTLDSLGGTIGTDGDILFATSNTVPVEVSAFALE